MKRDHTTIKDRIDKLGLKQVFVAEHCKIDPTIFNKIMKGERIANKDRIELIHEFLDLVKTRFVKKNGKWVEIK